MAIKKYVILVAGHGGGDPGAVGQGSTEARETIQITDRVHKLLLPHPNVYVDVVPHSLDYVPSTAWINARYKNLNDGVVVEIHKNSTIGATGVETFTPIGPDKYTTKLATKINNELARVSKLSNRGVKAGGFYLITSVNQRAVLVEAGFMQRDPIDNAADARYALGIANGICDFFGEKRPNLATPKPKPSPTKPKPAPKPKPEYYTIVIDGKQLAAYSNEQNAYNGYTFHGSKGSIVYKGKTVTKPIVDKFKPKAPKPTPKPPAKAETNYSKENNGLLKQILDTLKRIFNLGSK